MQLPLHLTPGLLDYKAGNALLHPPRSPIARCWNKVDSEVGDKMDSEVAASANVSPI